MSLPNFLTHLKNDHNGNSRIQISIVDDNARLGTIPISISANCIRNVSDSTLKVEPGGCSKKVHPDILIEKKNSDTALSMPQREDSLTSLTTKDITHSSKLRKGENHSDRWTHLFHKDKSLLPRKSQLELHEKLFGDSALSIPSRLLSPQPRIKRNPLSLGAHEKTSSVPSDVDIRNKMLSITSSALAIVSGGFDDFPIVEPLG